VSNTSPFPYIRNREERPILDLGPACINRTVLVIKEILRKKRIKLTRMEYLDLKILIFAVKSQIKQLNLKAI
jgi:hypothetical protein